MLPSGAEQAQREAWRGSLDEPTLCAAFQRTVRERAEHPALRAHGRARALTFGDYGRQVRQLAGGLAGLGVGRGDTVACMLVNRPEFHVCDAAAMHLGAACFSLYNTSPSGQLAHILADAAPSAAFTEPQFAERLRCAIAQAGVGTQLIMVEGHAPGAHELAQLWTPTGFDFQAAWQAVRPDDLLTLIYTSGTTGPAKGVELTHANMLAQARALEAHFGLPMGGRTISYLPAAHIADRALNHYAGMLRGVSITCCAEPTQLFVAAVETAPTVFGGVPRVWEKLAAALEPQLGRHPTVNDREAAELRGRLGLSEVEAFIVGAAPTPVWLFEFFARLGIELLESWGMSELCSVGTIAPAGAARPGAVGVPLPGVELRLDSDGEILVRGPIVMRGYRNLPEQTAACIDPDGWLRTGDVGALDDDGQLRIVDRKKEMIVNAAGKNMSPANIEAELRVACPLVEHAVVIGDGRPFNVALLTLDPELAAAWAQRQELVSASTTAELAAHPLLTAELAAGVGRANARLARVEQIKRFRVLGDPWQPGADEITPTLKLKRRAIETKYACEVQEMFAGSPASAHVVEMDGAAPRRQRACVRPLGERVSWSPVPSPSRAPLQGAHVTLRQLDPARDAEPLYVCSHPPAGDPTIWTYLPDGPYENPEQLRQMLTWARDSEDPLYFALVPTDRHEPLGIASYLRIDRTFGVVEIGHIWFGPELQRTTAATEAIYLLASHVFDQCGYRRLEWKCNALNAASRRAAQRFGFSFEGVFRKHQVVKGRNRDTAWYAIVDDDWPAVRSGFHTWLDPANFDGSGRQRQALGELIEAARHS